MTPTAATPFLPRWILLSLAVLLLVSAAVFLPGVLLADWSPFSAQSEDGSEVPDKPTGLSVATEQGSMDVSADWDDVEGADDYLVRWRPNGERLNEGVRAQSSSAAITVAAYGEWVVRVQACNDAGCGKPAAERFSVAPAPEPTPTPTQNIPNNPPVFDRNNIRFPTVLENHGPLINAGTYVVRDPENDQITRSLAGADAASFSASQFLSGNELRIFLDLNATPDYESPADANGDGVYEVTIRATDVGGSGETTELDVTVTVLDVDEAPVITGPAAVSFAEHSVTGVGQYSAADPEGETATLALGGTDAASFTFADGTLTFNAAPDYETQDSYSATLTASDGTNTSTLGVTITITDVDETAVNFGPVVDDQAERYQGFTGTDNAPRGTLVSKVYDGIFSDPNGDELTYTVSVPADRSGLVDTVYVLEDIQRVFIRLDAEDDWGAVTPALPKPLVTTVTLTATDPGGLSASVTGEFRTNWEAAPAPALSSVCDRTPQVRDVLVKLLGKACENIGAEDLARVVKLDLSNKGLRSLRTEDFSGMSSLREVDASSNNFTSWTDACAASYGDTVQNINLTNNKLGGTGARIPAGCFTATKFPELRSLHLAATRTNSLAGNPFDGLTKLEILDLSQNQITIVPVATFEDLSELWYLDLGRNALTSSGLPVTTSGSVVTDAVFDDLSSLEWLALNNQFEQDSSNNFEPKTTAQLTTLNTNVFKGLSSLKELDLANNGFTKTSPNHLPNGVFTPLTSLESLALFGNSGAPWTAAQLITMGVRNDGTNLEAEVIQVVTPPTGFTVEPVSGGVKLTWDDPSDTSLSYQYRFLEGASLEWSDWTAISNPTSSSSKFTHTVTSDVSSGNGYVFQLRSVKSGAHSWRANADCNAIFGTAGNDTLTGSFNPDCIIGLAGNDTLNGGGGADKLDGGAGTDTASYAGSDEGVEVDLSISTGQAANGISHSRGDVLSNIENLIGSAHDDTLTGDSNANNIRGGKGDDTVDGGDGGDTLWGEGGTGDTLTYASSDAAVTVNLANRTASGGHAQGDTGLGGFENLIGSEHADTLTGSAGDNVIEGGAGADTMTGGAGTDTLSYASSTSSVWVDIGATPEIKLGDAQGDSASGFENLIGSTKPDILKGDDNDNVINGNGGRDEIDGRGGNDTLTYESLHTDTGVVVNVTGKGDTVSNIEIIIGTPYGDTINVGSLDNTIRGGDGDDKINGGDGDDKLYGGNGNDHFTGGAGADTIDGGDGGDLVIYSGSPGSGDDGDIGVTVNLTTGINTGGDAQGDRLISIQHITGSAHNDKLTGDDEINYFVGGAGADAFDGKGGDDWVLYFDTSTGMTLDMATPANSKGNAAGDTFTSIERIVGSVTDDTITGNKDDNILSGHWGNDTIKGGGGDDIIYGGRGQDELRGDAGDDKIHGAAFGIRDRNKSGAVETVPYDKIWGGAGDDKMAVVEGWGALRGGAGNDEFYFMGILRGITEIWDYASGEKIWICRGSGGATSSADASDGEVWWVESLATFGSDMVADDWLIELYQKEGSNDVSLGNIKLIDVATSPDSNIAWSDPAAAVGTGCNFIQPWAPWGTRDNIPFEWKEEDN